MSPKVKKTANKIKTKQDALNWIKKTYTSAKTVKLYSDNLEKICRFFETDDISKLLSDPKEVIAKIKTMTYEKNPNKLVSSQSIKSYLTTIRTLTKDDKVAGVDKDKQEEYNKEMLKTAKLTDYERGKAERKGVLAEHPDLTWPDVEKKRDEFHASKNMTTRNLTHLTLISLNTMIRPRRLDARHLKVYHTLPDDLDDEASYVLLGPGKSVKICYGQFKTRMRMGKEFMIAFKKPLPGALASLIRQLVKKTELKDGDYLFFNGTRDEQYSDSAFSKLLSVASENVTGIKLTANCYRRLFMDWITDNYKDYNHNDLRQIAREMGDHNVFTALQYAFTKKQNADDTITQINEKIIQQREDLANRIIRQEEEGSKILNPREAEEESVGTPENVDDVMEQTTQPLPFTPPQDAPNDVLLDNLWVALKPVLLKLMR